MSGNCAVCKHPEEWHRQMSEAGQAPQAGAPFVCMPRELHCACGGFVAEGEVVGSLAEGQAGAVSAATWKPK